MIFINDKGDLVEIAPWYDDKDDWATAGIRKRLDEQEKRIEELHADIEYYKSELWRSW